MSGTKALAQFKSRTAKGGQVIDLSRFSNLPGGEYVDSLGGGPDPDSESYPASRPQTTYDEPVTLSAFVQPGWSRTGGKDGAEKKVTAVWGDEVVVNWVVYVAGDQTIESRDKMTYLGEDFYVAAINLYSIDTTIVYKQAFLTRSIPRQS